MRIEVEVSKDLIDYVGTLEPPMSRDVETFLQRYLEFCAGKRWPPTGDQWKRPLKQWILTEFGEFSLPEDLEEYR